MTVGNMPLRALVGAKHSLRMAWKNDCTYFEMLRPTSEFLMACLLGG